MKRTTATGARLTALRTSNAAGRHARGTRRHRTRTDQRRAAIKEQA